MNSPRYALIVAPAALLVALALAGCSGGGGEATPTAEPT